MEKWKDGKTAKIEMCLCAKKKKKGPVQMSSGL